MINFILYLVDKLFKRNNLDNGFIFQFPKKEDWKHGLFGVIKTELNPSKNWKPYRSTGEMQRRPNSSETMACTTYSCLNAIEQIMNFMKIKVENEEATEEMQELVKIFEYFEFYENLEANLSDPFTAKMSGTSRRGNTFNNVCQSFRHHGIVAEKVWPTPEQYTWREYYQAIPQAVKDKGKEFTEYVEINHEWVYPNKNNETKVYSPNTTSVYAGGNWNSNVIHGKPTQRHNHAVDNDYFEDKKYDGIFDSYKPFDKKVSWHYGLGTGKIFIFTLKKPLKNKYQKLLDKGTKYVIRSEARGEFYVINEDGLKFIPKKEEIKKIIVEETDLNADLVELTKQKKIMWINEDYYNKLK